MLVSVVRSYSWGDGDGISCPLHIHFPLTGAGHMVHQAVRGAVSQWLPI